MWADNPPEPEFITLLDTVFTNVRGEIVEFPNPIKGGTSSNTVYTCKRAP